MPAYNFKARFVSGVETGRKPCTIRAKRKDGRRPRVGQTAYLYHGMRRAGCRLLRKAPIVLVQDIRIRAHGATGVRIWLDGKAAGALEIIGLASLDGFDSPIHLRAFFEGEYGLPFRGDLIMWDTEKEKEVA